MEEQKDEVLENKKPKEKEKVTVSNFKKLIPEIDSEWRAVAIAFALIAIVVVLLVVGRNNGDTLDQNEYPTHTHVFGDWEITKVATCSENGKKERSCSCGKKEIQNIAMIAHTEVIDNPIAPTCTENGISVGKHCSVCNKVIVPQETIKSKGHNYVNATCTVCESRLFEICEIGVSYRTPSGLYITLNSFTRQESNGYYQYNITYTLENRTPNTEIGESTFKAFFDNGNKNIPS